VRATRGNPFLRPPWLAGASAVAPARCSCALVRRQPHSCFHPCAHAPIMARRWGASQRHSCVARGVWSATPGGRGAWIAFSTSHAGRSSSATLSLSRTGRARVVWCVLLRARQRWFGIVPRWWAAGTACVVAHDPLNRAAAPHATPALLPHRVPNITTQTRLVYLAILAGWQQACMVCMWTAVVQH